MKHLDSRVWRLARELGCRVEPSDPGFDLECGQSRKLMVWVRKRSGYITWERMRSAYNYYPDVILVDREGRVVGEVRWVEFERLLGREVLPGYRVELRPGRLGEMACIVGDPRDIERIRRCISSIGPARAASYIARLCG